MLFIDKCTWLHLYILSCCVQDTILVIPPYPYCIEEVPQDVPLEDCWYTRPQLHFTYYLCPKNGRPQKNPTYRISPDDLCYHLVFLGSFEDLKLPISWPMERAGVTKLHEPSPTPCLYVAPASCMVGRVPLIPLFLAGNSTATLPHKYSQHKSSGFPMGSCDTAERMAGVGRVAAMCMRLTCGRGSLDVASRTWVVCQSRRLLKRRRLLCRRGACVEQRLAGIARLIRHDGKRSVVVNKVHISTYSVCTLYIRVYTGMYFYIPC